MRTPSQVARAVMENTDHHLLAGAGAQKFARTMGFTIEDDLNTPNSRAKWLEWKRRTDKDHYLDPKSRAEAGWRVYNQYLKANRVESGTRSYTEVVRLILGTRYLADAMH